jgi:methylglyoxal synthase
MAMFDIGLTAQKSKKWELANLIEKYRDGICQHSIAATSDTGLLINSLTGIRVGLLSAGSEGGHVQMARLVSNNNLRMVIFLHDSKLSLDDYGVILLLQACCEYNIPFANNITTAEFILHRFLEKEMATYWRCPEIRYRDFVEV